MPVVVGAVQNPASGPFEDSLSGTIAVATEDTAQGWYAYAPSYYDGDLAAISMADPTNPTIVGEGIAPRRAPGRTDRSTVNIFNGVAYVASKNMNGHVLAPRSPSTCDAK